MLNAVKRWLGREAPLTGAARAIDRGRSGIETVLGLPHRLAVPLLRRHFGEAVHPSDEEFRETGKNGYWSLPTPGSEFEVRLFGDDTGRVTVGTIRGTSVYSGLVVVSEWSPENPVAVWQVRLEESATDSARALHDFLLGDASS
ncbi:hypothetical protein [Thioalkalivibrio sp. ARh3]|uniref:hypothetical protein n=1 Tax=Thioalkalivibrio sp. ARh3 TaxID=1158148 RepID=UPI00036BA2CC|nr:hypothetical protein [Thioalkalivibrio sp. ARh3]